MANEKIEVRAEIIGGFIMFEKGIKALEKKFPTPAQLNADPEALILVASLMALSHQLIFMMNASLSAGEHQKAVEMYMKTTDEMQKKANGGSEWML